MLRALKNLFDDPPSPARMLPGHERRHLIEHMWRIAYADGQLDAHEDHYVRKIGHLLYVPNTQSMLARNHARVAPGREMGAS